MVKWREKPQGASANTGFTALRQIPYGDFVKPRDVRRIRELERAKVSEKLQDFQIGDKVSFEHEGNTITGTVIRVNRKSLSVRTDRGNWYVDPRSATKKSKKSLTSGGLMVTIVNMVEARRCASKDWLPEGFEEILGKGGAKWFVALA